MKKLFYVAAVIIIAVLFINSFQSTKKQPEVYDITVIGKVVTFHDNLVTIKILTGLHLDDAILVIDENTKYSEDACEEFLKNNIIVVEIESNIECTKPVKLTAKKVLSNKPIK